LSEENSQDLFEEITNSDEFNELIHIGHIVRSFEWYNHKFEIRTLKLEEELIVGQIVKEFTDTIAEEKAAAVAIAAACIVSINNTPFMPRYDKSAYINIKEKFNYILKNWNWIIIESINGEYVQLLASMYDEIERVENLSSKDLKNSSSFSDPLTDQVS